MLESLIPQNESKTLEFKEKNTEPKTKRIEYKKCDISYQIYGNKHEGFSATYCITIHAEDTVDYLFELGKSYFSSDQVNIEVIKRSKKWIDHQLESGCFKPVSET